LCNSTLFIRNQFNPFCSLHSITNFLYPSLNNQNPKNLSLNRLILAQNFNPFVNNLLIASLTFSQNHQQNRFLQIWNGVYANLALIILARQEPRPPKDSLPMKFKRLNLASMLQLPLDAALCVVLSKLFRQRALGLLSVGLASCLFLGRQ